MTEVELLQKTIQELNAQLYKAYKRINELQQEKTNETQRNNQIQQRSQAQR